MTPDVTIIIPVYNTASYLKATIASLEALDPRLTYQFICVDDGSTDTSPHMLAQWAQRDGRVEVYTQRNQGQSVARNAALSHVRGMWTYFLDSDDILMPDALVAAHAAATRHGADMVLFSGTIIDEQGQHIDEAEGTIFTHQRYQRPDALPGDRCIDGVQVMDILLKHYIFRAVPWLYMVRTDFLRNSGITFHPGIIHEDELFTATLTLACHNVVTLHRTLVLHRIRQSSTMGQRFSRRNMDCLLTVIDGVEQWVTHHPERRRPAWDYCRYTLNHVLITARSLPLPDRWAALRRIVGSGYLPYVEPKRLILFIYGR
ncbi:MAG: glycosyltransferase [Bacteroidaceae bacterium]|nr:glycosyltransferase [Bacteroidaceae bacterium]